MHNEMEAIREIKDLSKNAKMHLSHILRNGLMLVMSENEDNIGVNKRIFEIENKLKELGL
ncbi:MAG: hypothetical protein AABZ23_06465 [Deltaproteobacteria bacterium]